MNSETQEKIIEPVLVTFPGKLGDLIYTLPAVMSLKDHFDRPVHFITSPYCRTAQRLLKVQPYLDDCLVDETYVLDHARYGCQPFQMSEPKGYSKIFHLGFRMALLGKTVLKRPLTETFYYTLEQVYGLHLSKNVENRYLFLEQEARKDFAVFQGYGQTLMDLTDAKTHQRLYDMWQDLFSILDLEIKIVTGPEEKDFYAGLGWDVVCPHDLFETARLIKKAKCFIGVQSVAAAIADGLKCPRLILNVFQNALPRGDNGMFFLPEADVRQVADEFRLMLSRI